MRYLLLLILLPFAAVGQTQQQLGTKTTVVYNNGMFRLDSVSNVLPDKDTGTVKAAFPSQRMKGRTAFIGSTLYYNNGVRFSPVVTDTGSFEGSGDFSGIPSRYSLASNFIDINGDPDFGFFSGYFDGGNWHYLGNSINRGGPILFDPPYTTRVFGFSSNGDPYRTLAINDRRGITIAADSSASRGSNVPTVYIATDSVITATNPQYYFPAESGVLATRPWARSTFGTLVTSLSSPSNTTYPSTQAISSTLQTYVNTSGVVVSSAASLSISTGGWYIFSGTISTWTLPNTGLISGSRAYFIKNRGSGILTINSNSGGNDIYTTLPVNTLALTAGEGVMLIFDGTYFSTIN